MKHHAMLHAYQKVDFFHQARISNSTLQDPKISLRWSFQQPNTNDCIAKRSSSLSSLVILNVYVQ